MKPQTLQELYNQFRSGQLTENRFMYFVRRQPQAVQWVAPTNTCADAITILKRRKLITDPAPKAEPVKLMLEAKSETKSRNEVSAHEFRLGFMTEFAECNDPLKAEQKVLKNLTKDANYYTHQIEKGKAYLMEEQAPEPAPADELDELKSAILQEFDMQGPQGTVQQPPAPVPTHPAVDQVQPDPFAGKDLMGGKIESVRTGDADQLLIKVSGIGSNQFTGQGIQPQKGAGITIVYYGDANAFWINGDYPLAVDKLPGPDQQILHAIAKTHKATSK